MSLNDTLKWDAPGDGVLAIGSELRQSGEFKKPQKKKFGKYGGGSASRIMKFGKVKSERSSSISSSGSDKI